MKKRIFIHLIVICLLLTAIAPVAYAEETTAAATEGSTEATETTAATEAPTEAPTETTTEPKRAEDECGDDLKWTAEGSTLYIIGNGAMDDYSGNAPWAALRKGITSLVLSGNVTYIGAGAFADFDSLTSVNFGGSLVEIGTGAFKNCDGLTSISLPSTFRRFGAECFMGCSKLEEVHCSGSMPSFKSNCLWNGNTITVYCPVSNPWPQVYVEELENNFSGRLQVLASDKTDPYKDTETKETTAPTTVPTEPETEPTTEATMEPTIETTAATEPETEATTEATTEPEETTEETVPQEEEIKSKGMGGLIAILVVVGVLTALLIAVMIFRWKKGAGGRYED